MRSTARRFAGHPSKRSAFPSPRHALRACLGLLVAFATAFAEPSARLELPRDQAWTGQQVRVFVELSADGTFTGAASFDIPRIPDTFIVKVGNPVLGSLTRDGTEYFTQRHEFALFSQAGGSVEIPPITARFSHRKGYTGPSFDESLKTEPATLAITRPPGSSEAGFLVTTDSLEITEAWDPPPGPVETGAVFKRTIVQRASRMTGIALAPASTEAPEGIRVYAGQPEVNDRAGRGELSGERRETITYLVQQPGLHILPAIRYDWWNPTTETLESKTLPPVTFSATAPPPPPERTPLWHFLWPVLPLGLAGVAYRFRKPVAGWVLRLHDLADPPSRRARRAFLHACEAGDPDAAAEAWTRLRPLLPGRVATPEFEEELRRLHRRRYGPGGAPEPWSGEALAAAFRQSTGGQDHRRDSTALPALNS